MAEARLPESMLLATWYGDQDENGVDLTLIRELRRLSPVERLQRAEKAKRDALRLLEYGRRNREEPTRATR